MDVIMLSAYRTIIAYFLLLLLCRLMGRKMISQMTFFDFVVGITIGSVAANMATGPTNPIRSGTTVLIALTLLTILLDLLHIKGMNLRKIIDSEPLVLIKQGKIVDENMRKERVSINELNMMLREKNAFNIADVEFAILETDGKLSVQKKSEKQSLTPSDMQIVTPYQGLEADLVMDGEIMRENLQNSKHDEVWLEKMLKSQGIQSIKEVFYAGLDSNGKLYVSRRTRTKEQHGQHGME